MVSKTITKHPKSLVEVTVTVPWMDIQNKWNETLERLANETELPGFRRGQAPIQMVEQQLGNKLQEEALKVIMPETLIQALQGTNIVPIDYPRYQVVSFAKGQQLIFKALVTEKPEVKVGEYKGIRANRPSPKTITDEDVNKLVDDLFKRWKSRQPMGATSLQGGQGAQVETQSPSGNAGSINFGQPKAAGLVDAQGNPLGPQALADKQSTPSEEKPNDDFARAVGAQNLDDLKNRLKADLESEAKYNNELDYEEAILQEVEKITQVEIPDILIEDELSRMLVSLQKRVSEMGLLLEDYLKSQNETVESIKNKWKPQAERNMRMELGLAEVARLEGVQVSDAELQAEIDKIQDARLKAQFESQEPRLHLKHSLRQIKTLDLLKTLVKVA